MALYVDENGDELSGRQEGELETLTELVNALGDYWNNGTLTLVAAVKVYAQVAALSEAESAEFLIGLWVDDSVTALEFGDY
jgi:hypothetical protein